MWAHFCEIWLTKLDFPCGKLASATFDWQLPMSDATHKTLQAKLNKGMLTEELSEQGCCVAMRLMCAQVEVRALQKVTR